MIWINRDCMDLQKKFLLEQIVGVADGKKEDY